MFLTEFDQIIKEYFDMTDRPTRQYIIGLDEAGNDQLLAALSARLYDNIVAKVGEIDFGTIPRSRGDITKVEKFDMTMESLDIVRRLVLEYKENTSQVDTILTAVENIKDNKSLFIKGYSLNIELPMLIYNLITLSIIRSTSLIIATCIKYVADPSTKSMKMAFDKVAYKDTETDVLYQQLISFNEMCKDGSLVKLLNSVITNGNRKVYMREDTYLSDKDTAPDGPDTIAQPMDVNNTLDNGGQDIDPPAAADEPFANAATPVATPNEEDEIATTPAPNPEVMPGSELPDDSEVLAGAPADNAEAILKVSQEPTVATSGEPTEEPSSVPANAPVPQPVIPENRMSDSPALNNESVEKNIETDSTFDKELAGAKESPVDDKDDEDLRDGKEKYDSNQVEAIKQKIIGKALEANHEDIIKNKIINAYHEANSEGPLEDKDADKLRDGKEKYDSNKTEGKDQEPIGKALESSESIEEVSAGEVIKKAKDYYTKLNPTGKIAIASGGLIAVIAAAKVTFNFFIKFLIPWLRNLVYTFNYAKMKLSDYFQIQAELIESNANEIESTTADDDDKKKQIIQKQRKWADRFRKWSNMFNIDRATSEKKADEEMKKEDKEKRRVEKDNSGDDVLF